MSQGHSVGSGSEQGHGNRYERGFGYGSKLRSALGVHWYDDGKKSDEDTLSPDKWYFKYNE